MPQPRNRDIPDESGSVGEGVGFTALLVAAARAVDTSRPDGLVDDPWAGRFADAAHMAWRLPGGPDGHGDATFGGPDAAPEQVAFWALLSAYLGLRSRYFDDALIAATGRGIDQVVLLGAGLDARAVRLPWAEGTTVYEIDQAGVLAYKDAVFAAHGARPGCDRRLVAVDLRDDWVAALVAAGLEPGRPSVWVAEGLLPFLPAAAEAALFADVDRLTAPGSVLAVEHFTPFFDDPRALPQMIALGAAFGVDVNDVANTEPRTAAAQRLAATGWTVSVAVAPDLARGYGRPLPDGPVPMDSFLLTATRP